MGYNIFVYSGSRNSSINAVELSPDLLLMLGNDYFFGPARGSPIFGDGGYYEKKAQSDS